MAKRGTRSTTNNDPEITRMLDGATHCLCCGHDLGDPKRKGGGQNRGYCRRECFLQLPPKMAYAAWEYGENPEELILRSLNETDNLTVTAGLLGVGKGTLYAWLGKMNIRRIVRWEAAKKGGREHTAISRACDTIGSKAAESGAAVCRDT